MGVHRRNGRAALAASLLSAAGCLALRCSATKCGAGDVDCYLAHFSLSENGQKLALIRVPTSSLPQPTTGDWTLGHWDGGTWSGVPNPSPTAFQSTSSGTNRPWLWGAGPADVWLVAGGGTTLHFDGGAWSGVASGTSANLHSVWGSSAVDVWAGGDQGVLLHWNGAAWSPATAWTSTQPVWGIWGTSPTDVWVLATDILHWDGASWTTRNPPDSGVTATGLWGKSSTDVLIVGTTANPTSVALMVWAGTSWTSAPPIKPNAFNGPTAPGGPWGPPALGDLWVSGTFSGGPAGVAHYFGSQWTVFQMNQTSLSAFWGSGASDVWAVGSAWPKMDNAIAHWDGGAWADVPSGTTGLTTVWGSGPTDVWAAGVMPSQTAVPPGLGFGPTQMAFTPSAPSQPLDLAWTDPNGCTPSFCFRACRVDFCSAQSACTHLVFDGATTGTAHFGVSYDAQPAATTDTFDLEVSPVIDPPLTDPGKQGPCPGEVVGPALAIPQSVSGPPPSGGNNNCATYAQCCGTPNPGGGCGNGCGGGCFVPPSCACPSPSTDMGICTSGPCLNFSSPGNRACGC